MLKCLNKITLPWGLPPPSPPPAAVVDGGGFGRAVKPATDVRNAAWPDVPGLAGAGAAGPDGVAVCACACACAWAASLAARLAALARCTSAAAAALAAALRMQRQGCIPIALVEVRRVPVDQLLRPEAAHGGNPSRPLAQTAVDVATQHSLYPIRCQHTRYVLIFGVRLLGAWPHPCQPAAASASHEQPPPRPPQLLQQRR